MNMIEQHLFIAAQGYHTPYKAWSTSDRPMACCKMAGNNNSVQLLRRCRCGNQEHTRMNFNGKVLMLVIKGHVIKKKQRWISISTFLFSRCVHTDNQLPNLLQICKPVAIYGVWIFVMIWRLTKINSSCCSAAPFNIVKIVTKLSKEAPNISPMRVNDDCCCTFKHDLCYTLAITTLGASLRTFRSKYTRRLLSWSILLKKSTMNWFSTQITSLWYVFNHGVRYVIS